MDRKAILDGFRRRRSHAATDNLIVDFRAGSHFMGESFTTTTAEPIRVSVRGTADIARVSLIRSNRVIHTVDGNGPAVNFTFVDGDRAPGQQYHYARIEQKDGQLAWSSPVWVESK